MVEHETGLEILVISVSLAETAVKLVSWGWKKWKERRGETRPPEPRRQAARETTLWSSSERAGPPTARER